MTTTEELKAAHDYARKCFQLACSNQTIARVQYDIIRVNYIAAMQAYHDALEAESRERHTAEIGTI